MAAIRRKEEDATLVSLILPTLNASAYLPELLSRLQNQSHKLHEIIVVDSTSKDDTFHIAKQYGATVLQVDKQQFDHGGTRNIAASHATGDILVFMTQDAIPADERFIAELISPFQDPTVAGVYGRQAPREDANPLEKMTREFNYPMQPSRKTFQDVGKMGIKTFFFTNVCSAVRRDVFESAGGFPQPIIVNEDMILASRFIIRGMAIVYQPNACVFHSHNYTLFQSFKRYFDIGVSLRMNDWLLGYARAEGEGLRLLKTQYRQLKERKLQRWLPLLISESVVKYAGYRAGLAHWALPRSMCRFLSAHKAFWKSDTIQTARTNRERENRAASVDI